MRGNQFNAKLCQFLLQRVRIIRFVTNHLFRSLISETVATSVSGKFDFMRRSTCCVNGERKTSAVCYCHCRNAFAPLGFPTQKPFFFAAMNVPSIKASIKSKLPRKYKSSAHVSRTFRNRPSLTDCWKRRWQVWYGGKRAGKSARLAPERKIHSTRFKTSRASRKGLPRVWISSVLSNNGLIKDHCSSVNSSRFAVREFYQTIFEMASSKAVLFRLLLRVMRVADVLLFSYVNRNINSIEVFKIIINGWNFARAA
jgi:hypothetical protein